MTDGDCGATVLANYEMTWSGRSPTSTSRSASTCSPDGRVLQTDRRGGVRLHDTKTNTTKVLAQIPVCTHSEDGMYGPAVDNDFATNRWVYL
ncbi:PQQ-dependent sugar dehydrogenase [Micromonospora olivasterospora]|uniref:Glucose/sorbosone dehydrogenase n=1 Tax=Micromonospora olivasterospora TaxID=1880 RepID=A0A562I563_MICOL|nr:PQQ-dependent sugar dehydrogenase [Micromonospora olivasterospora]TWH65956.1 glucose/sorbosone dehydrogenase [Micromonospora olivasterospora]